jgi:lipopolysaccharide assembly outer membrane protein LptD (OstA)
MGIRRSKINSSATKSQKHKGIMKKPLLLNDVKYDASDSIIINQKDNKIILYNNAKIVYGDIELTSGLIILDYKKNEIYAGRIADKDGNLSQYPVFKEGPNTVNPDSIKYNFNTQKALIWNSKSEENGMNILATLTKKQNDSVYFLKDGKVTTGGSLLGGETEDADYYFRIRKFTCFCYKSSNISYFRLIVFRPIYICIYTSSIMSPMT